MSNPTPKAATGPPRLVFLTSRRWYLGRADRKSQTHKVRTISSISASLTLLVSSLNMRLTVFQLQKCHMLAASRQIRTHLNHRSNTTLWLRLDTPRTSVPYSTTKSQSRNSSLMSLNSSRSTKCLSIPHLAAPSSSSSRSTHHSWTPSGRTAPTTTATWYCTKFKMLLTRSSPTSRSCSRS
jgi:hypothetical protein